jgi:hypothetical protein
VVFASDVSVLELAHCFLFLQLLITFEKVFLRFLVDGFLLVNYCCVLDPPCRSAHLSLLLNGLRFVYSLFLFEFDGCPKCFNFGRIGSFQ